MKFIRPHSVIFRKSISHVRRNVHLCGNYKYLDFVVQILLLPTTFEVNGFVDIGYFVLLLVKFS